MHAAQRVTSAPDDGEIIALIKTGDFDEAAQACEARLSLDLGDAAANHLAGVALRGQGQAQQALDFHARAVKSAPMRADYLYELGRSLAVLKLRSDAVAAFSAAEWLDPDEVEFALAHARCLYEAGDPTALTKAEAVLNAHPDHPAALALKGSALLALGRRQAAIKTLLRLRELDPINAPALTMLVKHLPLEDAAELDRDLTELVARHGETSVGLHFARAELSHRLGRFEEAHHHYAVANGLEAARLSYDPGEARQARDDMKALFSAPVETAPEAQGPAPIFIVGLPRTGSTLLENILAAHGDVTSLGEIGELGNAIRRLSGRSFACQREALMYVQQGYLTSASVAAVKTPFFVDKFLGNFFHIGHIVHAFPNARILHVTRDLRAVGWSVFRQQFSEGQVGFAYDPAHIAAFFDVYRNMMAFWENRFGDRILHLSYDRLVADPGTIIPRLIEDLGLGWEAACLEPHKVQRMVTTASKGQVTQGLYQGSSEVWRTYAPFAGPWISQLEQPSDARLS